MEQPLFFPRTTPPPAQPSSEERIRKAALTTFATHGIAATTFRMVAEAAGVSIGLVQHYFGSKSHLIAAVDQYVLQVVGDGLEPSRLPEPAEDALDDAGRRVTSLIAKHPDVFAYVGRALVEGGDIGSTVFDGLFGISAAQRDQLSKRYQTQPDLDPLWAALNPLILRIGAIIMRPYIERHLPEPFTTPAQLERWDAAVTALIRGGQLRDPPQPDASTPSPEPSGTDRAP